MSLSGLRGHRELYERLSAELASRPSHAYLFSGPAGIGKALVAQALAHRQFCERRSGDEFCCTPDRCPMRAGAAPDSKCDCCAGCVQVAMRVHPDFIHVAKLPRRTDVLIEQVRELIARLGSRPVRAPRMVAIVDDAETLNIPSQNALLKTLEEPPGYAIIFLIARSDCALLDTVRSRTRPVRFGPLATADIEAILIANGATDPAHAAALARLARGSAGRALALADEAAQPIAEIIAALRQARTLDFAGASRLAQDFFANREQARENLELIARLLEEILYHKLLGDSFAALPTELAPGLSAMAGEFDIDGLMKMQESALKAAAAIDAMANSRLQAENWWMATAAIAGR